MNTIHRKAISLCHDGEENQRRKWRFIAALHNFIDKGLCALHNSNVDLLSTWWPLGGKVVEGQVGSHWGQMRSWSGFRDGLRALHTQRGRVQTKEIVCVPGKEPSQHSKDANGSTSRARITKGLFYTFHQGASCSNSWGWLRHAFTMECSTTAEFLFKGKKALLTSIKLEMSDGGKDDTILCENVNSSECPNASITRSSSRC